MANLLKWCVDGFRRQPWLAVVCAYAAAAWWLAPTGYQNPNIYDEGLSVYGAARVLAGDVPYRDFWTVYPPGIFVLLAAIFKLFGASLLVERHASLLLNVTVAAMSFAVAAPIGGPIRAAWGAVVILLWFTRLGIFASAVIPALILSLSAIGFVKRSVATDRRRHLIPAALLTVAAAAFRLDFAVYISAAITTGLILLRFLDRRRTLVGGLPAALLYIAVTMVAGSVMACWMVALAGARAVVDQLIFFPLVVLPRFRDLPYPDNLAIYAPALMSAVAVIVGIGRIRRGWPAEGTTAFVIGLSGLLLLNQSRMRSDWFHIFPAFAFGVTALVAAAGKKTSRRAPGFPTAWFGLTAVLVTGATLAALPRSEPPAGHEFALERAAGLRSTGDVSAYEEAVRAVQTLTKPGERIFVGNQRHDMIFINDVLFYFLADRHSATRYHELHPGLATTEAVQREIASELDHGDVSLVILRTETHPPESSNESSHSSGVVLIDRFIRERFRPIARFGDYQLWQRR